MREFTLAVVVVGLHLHAMGCRAIDAGRSRSATSPVALVGSLENGKDTHFNCGVNVAYLCLRYFDRQCSVEGVAREMNAGSSLERQCSMLDLKKLFIANRLRAEGYAVDSIDTLPTSMPKGQAVVVRTKLSDDESAHFIVLIRRGDNRYVLLDPPLPNFYGDAAAIGKELSERRATGEVLLVLEGLATGGHRGPTFAANQTVDVGSVAEGVRRIVVAVPVRNAGVGELTIRDVNGPCSCFLGFDGDRAIGAGREGVLQLTFDRSKMPDGELVRTVIVSTNDPIHPHVTLTLKMNLNASPRESLVRISPSSANLGRVGMSRLGALHFDVTVMIPEEVDREPATVTVSTERQLLIARQTLDEEARAGSRRVHTIMYRVTVKPPRSPGVLRDVLIVGVSRSGSSARTERIPVVCDIVAD